MTLESFISSNRLRQRRDGCGDLNAIGRRGSIYEYDEGALAVTVMGAPSGLHWNAFRNKLKSAGCTIIQNGDSEGTALFDPKNPEQAQTALNAIRAYRKRRMSPEQRARSIETLRRAQERRLETHFEAKAE